MATLDNMPYDILLIIFDNIDLSDRLCLGLTCKRLAYLVTVSPRVPFIYKPPYSLANYIADSMDQPNQRRRLFISLTPEWYTVIPRLAKGWVPKDKFKYCWKCNRIMPRDSSYFEERLSKSKPLGWLWKINLTEMQWAHLNPRRKREYMVTRWLTDGAVVHESLEPQSAISKVYYPDLGVWADRKPDERGLECPQCLERELIYAKRRPQGFFEFKVSTRTFLTNLARLPVDVGVSAINTASSWIRSPC